MTIETLPATDPTVRERTPRDVLLAAARYIEEHGWAQGKDYIQPDRSACIIGGIYAVAGVDQGRYAIERVFAVIGTHNAEGWNDTPGRTEAEVLAALREAAR